MEKFTLADIRGLNKQVSMGIIISTKMVEIINEKFQQTNAKLVEELQQAKSLAPEVWWRMDEQVKKIKELKSELSAAKERVKELEEGIKKNNEWVAIQSIMGHNDKMYLYNQNLLTPKQHG